MTAHPIDTDRESVLREDANEHQPDDHGPGICGDPECFTTCVVDGCDWPCATAWLRDQLAAAEHRATRAEAQSEARRVDIEYWQGVARGNAVTVDVWKETALQERAAALDALEQIKVRDARIKVVERLALAADDGTEYEHNGHDPAEGEAECPGCWALGIRRALDGDE